MNTESKEEFLQQLPKDTIIKIKRLKFYKNLVLVNQRHGILENVETGELIKKSNWNFTISDVAKKLHVSRSWIYNNLQGDVRYIYLNNFDLVTLSIFYNRSIKELSKYRELSPIHLNTEDVTNWFNNNFVHGRRSTVIDPQRIFGQNAEKILLRFGVRSIEHLKFDMNDLSQYVLDGKLWNLCCKAPAFYKTSKYPIVIKPKVLRTTDFQNIIFHALNEYDYPANGMRELITSGADVYKKKQGSNSKMLFVLPNNDPFDVKWMYTELSKQIRNTSYSPRVIDDTIAFLKNIFVVPAVQYEAEFM